MIAPVAHAFCVMFDVLVRTPVICRCLPLQTTYFGPLLKHFQPLFLFALFLFFKFLIILNVCVQLWYIIFQNRRFLTCRFVFMLFFRLFIFLLFFWLFIFYLNFKIWCSFWISRFFLFSYQFWWTHRWGLYWRCAGFVPHFIRGQQGFAGL